VKIAVIGGAGQLGTLVLRRLAKERRVKQLLSLDREPAKVASNKIQDFRLDITTDSPSEALNSCDAVVHAAFYPNPASAELAGEDPNLRASRTLFEAASRAGVKHIVYVSGVTVYGPQRDPSRPLTESSPRGLQADSLEATVQHSIENYLDEFERLHTGITVTRLRPGLLIGRRMNGMVGQALRQRRLLSAGNEALPIVWDEDVADACALVIRDRRAGAFNLSADEPLPATELAREAGLKLVKAPRPGRGVFGRSPRLGAVAPAAYPAVWRHVSTLPFRISSAAARDALSWKPTCPTARDVMARYSQTAPRRLDRRLTTTFAFFDWRMRNAAVSPGLKGITASIHLDLTGASGGDLQITLDDGRVRLLPGVPERPTCVMTLDAALLVSLLSGKTEFTTQLLTGRIRTEGEPIGIKFLETMILGFRSGTTAGGARGVIIRRLAAWLEKGTSREILALR
jgi:nucleoside-diphosphate-sugar epimerase